MKIGPVDTELALLRVKKEKKKKLTQAKIIHSGKFAERAKKMTTENDGIACSCAIYAVMVQNVQLLCGF